MDASRAAASPRFHLEPFSYAEARTLVRELGIAEPVAAALVRRGLRTPQAARSFLAADEEHDPSGFAGLDDAVGRIRAALSADELITVHGDYDVDGVAATAILVATLREMGARCDWLIPARDGDGYGLTASTVERLADRGTRLLVTADCGIASAAEVAAARARGIDAIVTDHHQPPDALPDCPIVHPLVSGYPFPELCAAGVAYKLAVALEGPERAERHLDLVALATVADMVPLRGENRALARRGIAAARRGARPGLRALMRVAGVVPERLDEGDVAFRLAPRINAAGRLYRADAGVELMLTADPARAGRIAEELDRANSERRHVESEVLAEAERARRELSPELAEAPALVLWGAGWHAGVVGICASRMAERHGRPTILIALDEEGRGRGSGRSVPGFDLLDALRACAPFLARFGGHRAAAGLEVEARHLDAFRAAFVAHVAARLDPQAVARGERVDAVVGGESLGHDVAEQLAALGPFGTGNPPVRLLVPAAQVADVRPMGEGERHARFSLASGANRAAGVAFGVNGTLAAAAERGAVDVALRLELNEWNGAVEPRVVLDETAPCEEAKGGERWECEAEEYHARFEAELAGRPPAAVTSLPPETREVVARERDSGVAAVASLASTREPVLVLAADALWRRALVERLACPARFGGGQSAIVAARGSLEAGRRAAEEVLRDGGVCLADWAALELLPELAGRFTHVVVADPAPARALAALAEAGEGWLHVLPGARSTELAERALALAYPTRGALAAAWRALRDAGPGALAASRWREAVRGAPRIAPEAGARIARVLGEVGVLRTAGTALERTFEVVSSVRGELERTSSFARYASEHEERLRYLSQLAGRSSTSSALAA